MSNVDPYADLTPGPPTAAPGGNPYPPGTELADWYDRQLQEGRPAAPGAPAAPVNPTLSVSRDPMTGAAIGQDPYADLPAAGFTPSPPAPKEVYRGAILPLTRDTTGNIQFTPLTAGPVGSMLEAAQLPGRVYSGETKVDPNNPAFMGQVLNLAGTFGGVNPMVRSGDAVIPGIKLAPKDVRAAIKQTPSSEKLFEVGGNQIEAYRNMNIPYNPNYIGGPLAQQLEENLIRAGVFPEHASGLYRTIRRLRDYVPRSDDPSATISVQPSNLMAIRDSIKNHFDAGPNPKNNQHGVGITYRAFDQFLENPPAEAILGRPPTGARAVGAAGPASSIENETAAALGADIFKRGRANYSAGFRDEALAGIEDAATLRAGSANSGLNLGNQVRSKVTSTILNPERMVGYTPAEEAALRAIPLGTRSQNLQRGVSNILGGGGGIGSHAVAWGSGALANYLGLGPMASTSLGFAVPGFGMWLKNRVGQSTAEALRDVGTMTRQRSPLFQEQPFKERVLDPGITLSPRDRIARELVRTLATGGHGVPIPDPAAGITIRPLIDEQQ